MGVGGPGEGAQVVVVRSRENSVTATGSECISAWSRRRTSKTSVSSDVMNRANLGRRRTSSSSSSRRGQTMRSAPPPVARCTRLAEAPVARMALTNTFRSTTTRNLAIGSLSTVGPHLLDLIVWQAAWPRPRSGRCDRGSHRGLPSRQRRTVSMRLARRFPRPHRSHPMNGPAGPGTTRRR